MTILDDALLEEHTLASDLRDVAFADLVEAAAAHRGGFPGPVVDVAELLRGKTFLVADGFRDGLLSLRQYTSTFEEDDLDSVPPMDAVTVFERIRKAEEYLTAQADERFGERRDGRRGYLDVSKSKRAGEPGTQSLRFSSSPSPAQLEDHDYERREGGSVPGRLETETPAELALGEFRGGLTAAIPGVPSCAFDTILYLRPSARGRLCDLTGDQRWGLAQAVREVTGALRLELTVRGHGEEYDWHLHAGPEQDVYLRVTTPAAVQVEDGPAQWAAKLRESLGLE